MLYAAYDKARRILEKQKAAVPSELWNNIGVLYHMQGKLEQAEEAYLKALNVTQLTPENIVELSKFTDDEENKANSGKLLVGVDNVTILYNIARLKEDSCNDDLAECLYKAILMEHPNYVDCKDFEVLIDD
jgi:RNA polymerase-associated protein CTR9